MRRNARQPTEAKTASGSKNDTYDATTAITANTTTTKHTAITQDTIVSKLTPVERWRQNVLVPRGIEIVDDQGYDLALDHFSYFGTDEKQCREWIRRRLESEKDEDTVFLRGGDGFNTKIARQYTEITARNLCEEEFGTFAKTKLFTTPDFLPIEPKEKTWKAQRMIQLYTQPNTKCASLWVPPPLLSGEEYFGKDFYLKPDCTYWLSLQSSSKYNRGLVSAVTFTIRNRDTTPYLTIEFKSEGTVEQAINQATAASSLALFNRYRLKENRLRASKKNWNRKHFDQIRHYMMTFTGPIAVIWVVRLKLSAASDASYSKVDWNGCEAVRLLQCDCTTAIGVGDLVDWINAIHRWGEMHGAYCRRDVKAVLLAKSTGVAKRVSDLLDPADPIEDDEDEEDGQTAKKA